MAETEYGGAGHAAHNAPDQTQRRVGSPFQVRTAAPAISPQATPRREPVGHLDPDLGEQP